MWTSEGKVRSEEDRQTPSLTGGRGEGRCGKKTPQSVDKTLVSKVKKEVIQALKMIRVHDEGAKRK